MSYKLTASVLSALVIAAPAHSEESTGLPITVTANRFAEPTASVLAPVNIITRKDIEQIHARSVSDVVKTLPGVEISSYGGRGQQASAFVRGSTSAETLVLLDGVRVNSATSGGFDFNSIPLNQIERIEFVRGARASVYGADAIGGVINIITRGTQGESKHVLNGSLGSRNYQNLNGSSSFDINDQQHLKLAAGYESEDGYNVHPVAGVNDGDEHGFLGRNAMIDYQNQVNENTKVLGAVHFNRNTVQSDGSYSGYHERDETWEQTTNYQLGTQFKRDAYQTELMTSVIDTETFYYPDSASRYNPDSTYKTQQYQISWANNYQITEDWTVGGGVDWRREVLDAVSEASGESFFDDDKGRNNFGVYALTQYHWEQWLAELSARSDDNQQYGTHDTWQAGLGWNFLPEYRISTRYGTAFRAPTLNDLYYPNPWTHGNPNLKPETSKNAEISLDGTTADVLWRATAYRNDIRDMIQWADSDDDGIWTPENVGRARIDGLELEAEFMTGWISHKISADFKDPKDMETGELLARRSRTSYKWTGSVNWDQWDASLTANYQSKRLDGSTWLSPYTVWNASLGYRVTSHLKIGGRIDNLFDKDYVLVKGYKTAGQSVYLDASYQF